LWRNENRAAASVITVVMTEVLVTEVLVTEASVGPVAPVGTVVITALAEVLTTNRPDAIGFFRSICELQRARRPCLWVRDSILYPTARYFD
jgi:hypothetical protein